MEGGGGAIGRLRSSYQCRQQRRVARLRPFLGGGEARKQSGGWGGRDVRHGRWKETACGTAGGARPRAWARSWGKGSTGVFPTGPEEADGEPPAGGAPR